MQSKHTQQQCRQRDVEGHEFYVNQFELNLNKALDFKGKNVK